jgi:hypothetical protein
VQNQNFVKIKASFELEKAMGKAKGSLIVKHI